MKKIFFILILLQSTLFAQNTMTLSDSISAQYYEAIEKNIVQKYTVNIAKFKTSEQANRDSLAYFYFLAKNNLKQLPEFVLKLKTANKIDSILFQKQLNQILTTDEMDSLISTFNKIKTDTNKTVSDSIKQQLFDNYLNKARFLQLNFQVNDADKIYRKLVALDSTYFNSMYAFATFLDQYGHFQEAQPLYEKTIKLAPTPFEKANILTNQAINYQNNKDVEKAVSHYLEAQRIYEKDSTDSYQYFRAKTMLNLSNLLTENNDTDAITFTDKTLFLCNKLSKRQPQFYEPQKATLLADLGTLYMNDKIYDTAQIYFEKSLKIYDSLLNTNQFYLPEKAEILNNLGNLFNQKNQNEKVKSFASNSIACYEKLSKINPKEYLPYLAMAINNMGIFYYNLTENEAKEEYRLKGLECANRSDTMTKYFAENVFAQQQKDKTKQLKDYFTKIDLELLRIRNEAMQLAKEADSLVNIDVKTARKKYRKSIKLYEKLVAKDKNLQYRYNLSFVYQSLNNIEPSNAKRIENQEKVVATRTEVYKFFQNESTMTSLANACGNYSWYLLLGKQFETAEQNARLALETDPTQMWIKVNLGHALLFQGKRENAQVIYMEIKDYTYPPEPNKTFKNIILQDLKELENQGVKHKDVAKVRKMLED